MLRVRTVLLLLLAGIAVPAGAGHELSFYPSYYPQEIRIERRGPADAAERLRRSALHAYVGADPFPGAPLPEPLKAVDSLAGYVVLAFEPGAAAGAGRRCAAANALLPALAADVPGYHLHPYPVTPYHADFLAHADLAAAAREATASVPAAAPPAALRVRAVGAVAARLLGSRGAAAGPWEARLETVALDELVGPARTRVNDVAGPPWLKAGWYHAYRLAADALADPAARRAADEAARRLMEGDYAGTVERLELERGLVRRLVAGCDRVVVGYLTRREVYTSEFSAGIENVAADSQTGLDSAIFVRTAKLKDFPWNGWLTLGVPAAATAAWNPVAGFTDPTGRLVWAALGDPAFFPAPRGPDWIGNRVTAPRVTVAAGAGIPVPKDAELPEPGTGRWRPVGDGHTARTRITYRVLASAFHDGTRMSPADTLYGLSFAYRWGAGPDRGGDPAVRAAAGRLIDWLAGLRLLRVDATEREFGEVKFTSVIQTFEAYGRHALDGDELTASVTPPWTPVPWTVLALMDEAARRGLAAFSDAEARRLGIPWLDLARDPKLRDRLAALLDELAGRDFVPEPLRGRVAPDEARARWAALRAFYRAHGHLLVTNGPYRLASWSDDAVVLSVVRDLTYPLGVGSYDRYAIPLRAYVASAAVRGDRLEVQADVDVLEKFQRDYTIRREPLASQPPALDVRDLPVCRWVAVDADRRVVAAGTGAAAHGGYAIDLRPLPRPGRYTVLVGLYVRDNAVDVEVRRVPVERS